MKSSSPSPLGDFLGNEALRARLERMLAQNALPHALLLFGDAGCGRNFLARLLGAALLHDPNDLIERASHPDYLVLEGSGKSGQIAVESVRDIGFELRHSPVMAERRVVHIKDAAALNRSSSAALLKMLEEPPAGATFLLTSSSPLELLDTIVSRCVALAVEPIDIALCAAEARRRVPAASEAAAARFSRFFGGRLGLALAALRDESLRQSADDAERYVNQVLAGDTLGALESIDRYCDKAPGRLLVFMQHAALAAQNALYAGRDISALRAVELALNSHIDKIERNANLRLLATSLTAVASGGSSS